MAWVMVPVPEELIVEVQALLFQLKFQAHVTPWDADLMEQHLLSLGDEPRAVLSTVAAHVLAGDLIEDVQLARKLGVSVRELFGRVQEANHVTVGGSPADLLHSRQEDLELGDGGTRRGRVLFMLEAMAAMVHEGENALGLRSRPAAER